MSVSYEISPILFSLILEKIMQETLHDRDIFISIGGTPILNLRFSEDVAAIGGSNGDFQDLICRLVDRAAASRIEISTEKNKVIINITNNIRADVSMNGQKLEEVTSYKYLGATLCTNCTCSAEIGIRVASEWQQWPDKNRIWRSNTISFASKL